MDAPRLAAFTPTVFVLDVDETLLSGNINGSKINKLTLGAHSLLQANSDPELVKDGILYEEIYENLGDELSGMSNAFIAFYAKEKFNQFFENAAKANQSHHSLAVSVKVMTAALYTKNEMYAVLTKFFPHFEKVCPAVGAFDFYNRKDLYGKDSEGYDNFDYLPSRLKISEELTKKDASGRTVELIKGNFMNISFPTWQAQMPELTKENVYLLDDKNSLVLGAREYGFSAINFPTMSDTLDTEVPGNGSPESFEAIFAKMNAIVTSQFALAQ